MTGDIHHLLQQDSPDAIGAAIASLVRRLRAP
jgi:hypothetical protein